MLSIVIITFNSEKFIQPCLDSIFTKGYRDIEIVVIDNGSKDGTVSFIKEDYPQVILIENKENFGACRARNQGIEASSGDWILTLDCDVILDKSFISEVVRAMEGLSLGVGMIQAKILNSDKKTIYSTGISLSFFRRFYDIRKNKIDNRKFNAPRYIFGGCCAAALYKRQMLEEIKEATGYFDERFFFLVEDVDLAWRAQRKGWKAVYCPQAVCYHQGNSSNFDRKLRQYLCFRNRYYAIKKNEGFIRYVLRVSPLFYDLLRFMHLLLYNRYIFKKPQLN